MLRKMLVTALVGSTLACGSAEAGDHTGALLGGLAVGAVGGVILGNALSQRHPPAPVYVAPPQRVYAEPVEIDPYEDQMSRLHFACDDGDRRACIRFGIMIGKHQERVADWRRSHPDYFTY